MRRFMYKLIILCFIPVVLLTGCGEKEVEEPVTKPFSVSYFIKENDIEKSEKGKKLTYYYVSDGEITIYFVTNWNKGVISMRRFFTDKDKYDLQKSVAPAKSKCNDEELSIYIKEYNTVSDMDAFWDEIENSMIYKMYK